VEYGGGNGISILLQKINRLLLHFWLLEGRISFWNYLLQADRRISHIQNLSGGYNVNLDNTFVDLTKSLAKSNSDNSYVP